MRSINATLFILFSFISIFAQDGSISGRVSYGSDTPVHGTSVKLVQTNQTAVTNEQGQYSISNVKPGRYSVIFHVEGFSDATRTVTVGAGAEITLNVTLDIAALREQVTVTASGTEQSIFDSFQSVNSIGSTRILERAASSLGEVLENETGVAKRSFGPGSSRPVIRGFDGDRVLVLQDGIRTGSLGSQSGDHGETIDPMSAERIEVLKGPATLLYGSNAIGGVVNTIGHLEIDYHKGFRANATTFGGTANKQAGFSGGAEYGFNNFLFRGNLGTQRTGDYQTPLGKVHNSASRGHNGSFGGGYYAPKAWLGATFSSDIRRFGIPFAGEFHGEHGHEKLLGKEEEEEHLDVDIRSRVYNFRVAGGLRDLTNSFLQGVQYSVDFSNYRHKEIEIGHHHHHEEHLLGIEEHLEEEVATIFRNKTFSYRSLFEQQNYQNLSGRFGFEGHGRDYRVDGEEQLIDGKVKQNTFSAFTLQELNFKRFKLQFGGRVENNRYNTENPLLNDRSFTGFSGGAGINVGLWEGGAFVANYSHSFRAPALEELYNNGPHVGNLMFEIGNENLKAERSNGVDFSIRHNANRFRLTGDVFYYNIKNFIFLAPQDEDGDGEIDIEDGLFVGRYEQDNVRYFGAELGAEATFNKYLGGFLSFDVVRARLTDVDVDLPRIPPARLRLGLDIRHKGLSVRPEAVFASSQEKLFPLETRTAGYGIVNVAGSYTLGREHHAHIVSFNAYNLTDKLYRNHLSFIKDLMPEMGRGIRFGYTVRFF